MTARPTIPTWAIPSPLVRAPLAATPLPTIQNPLFFVFLFFRSIRTRALESRISALRASKLFFSLSVLTLSHFFCQIDAHGESPIVESPVILIQNENTGTCGSGVVLSDGTLLTANHLVDGSCRTNICKGITIKRDNGSAIDFKEELKVINRFSAFDLIAIKTSLKGEIEIGGETSFGNKVQAIGFSDCTKLVTTNGIIEKTSGSILETTTTGKKGMSGGALIGEDGKVIGIISQARSIPGALRSLIFNNPFELQAIYLNPFIETLNADHITALETEAELLKDFYSTEVQPLMSHRRIINGIRFSRMVDRVIAASADTSITKDVASRYIATADGPAFLSKVPESDLESLFEYLIVARAFELRGPFLNGTVPLNQSALTKNIEESKRLEEDKHSLKVLIERAFASRYPGAELMLVTTLLFSIVIILPLLFVWAFSLGWVWGKVKGSFINRVITLFVVALCLWPISLFAFMIRQRRTTN